VPLMQTLKEVNSHPCIVPCVNMWSFFLLIFLLPMSLVELLVHGSATLLRKAKWEVDM
jgi:hypothetical protein